MAAFVRAICDSALQPETPCTGIDRLTIYNCKKTYLSVGGYMQLMRLFLCGAVLSACGVSNAQVYKCGNTFSQRPCAEGAQQVEVRPVESNLTAAEIEKRNAINSAIARRSIIPGMTEANVRSAWGAPTTINRNVSEHGGTDQWVYRQSGGSGVSYVHFKKGVVTSASSYEGEAYSVPANTRQPELCDRAKRTIKLQNSSSIPNEKKIRDAEAAAKKYC